MTKTYTLSPEELALVSCDDGDVSISETLLSVDARKLKAAVINGIPYTGGATHRFPGMEARREFSAALRMTFAIILDGD